MSHVYSAPCTPYAYFFILTTYRRKKLLASSAMRNFLFPLHASPFLQRPKYQLVYT